MLRAPRTSVGRAVSLYSTIQTFSPASRSRLPTVKRNAGLDVELQIQQREDRRIDRPLHRAQVVARALERDLPRLLHRGRRSLKKQLRQPPFAIAHLLTVHLVDVAEREPFGGADLDQQEIGLHFAVPRRRRNGGERTPPARGDDRQRAERVLDVDLFGDDVRELLDEPSDVEPGALQDLLTRRLLRPERDHRHRGGHAHGQRSPSSAHEPPVLFTGNDETCHEPTRRIRASSSGNPYA